MNPSPRIALLALAASAALAPSAPSQANNTVLLFHVDSYAAYNDIWGYTSPLGKEYVLLGTTTGTAIYDATIPTATVFRGFIPGPQSTWRDIKTYGNRAYVVTEGGAGVQVIDLSNPDLPVLAATFGTALVSNSHNIAIDVGTGKCYVVGTSPTSSSGMRIFDLAVDPLNPPLVTSYNDVYVHDVYATNGLAHVAAINDGTYRILDVSSLPSITTLSITTTPGAFTHNTWTTPSGSICLTTDEVPNGKIALYDVTNLLNPVLLSTWNANPSAYIHNVHILGNIAHISHYTEGYRAVDISNPMSPVEIASYDTWPGASSGFNGAWGVYPYAPSGAIYVSDIQTGLYIVAINILDIDHTPLPDTGAAAGPYAVTATVTTSNPPVTGVDLLYSTNDGASFTTVAMAPTGNPNEYAASIPDLPAPEVVQYHLVAQNAGGASRLPQDANDEFFFRIGTPTTKFFDDFEGPTDNGWTHGLVSGQDDWQRGAPQGNAGDPNAAYSGTNVWANDLGAAGFNGAYQNNTNNFLLSPSVATGGASNLRLRFRRWLNVENGAADQARIQVNNQLLWQNPVGANTTDSSWLLRDYDVTSLLAGSPSAQLRFGLQSNGSVAFGGWTIDALEIYSLSDCLPPAPYGAGTAGTGGIVPTIGVNGAPNLGNASFAVTGGSFVGGAPALLVLGVAQTSLPIFGITLLVDIAQPTVQFPVAATGAAGSPGAGSASRTIPIPNLPSIDDAVVYTQWVAFDLGGPAAFSASNALAITVCAAAP